MQDLVGEDRHQHRVGHTGHAQDSQHDQQVVNGRAGYDESESFDHVRQGRCGLLHRFARFQPHQKQPGDHRDVAHAVHEKTPAFADDGHQDAGHGRADDARGVEHRGVQGDGVDQVFAPHHLHKKCLPRGDIESVYHPQQRRQNEDVPDPHGAGDGEGRQNERQQHGGGLRADYHPLAAEAIRHDTAQRSDQEHGDLPAEAYQAQQHRRPGEPVDQPGLGDVLHPRAGERDQLAAEEQLEIAITERAQRGGKRQLAAAPLLVIRITMVNDSPMPLVPPYIESLRPYEAGRSIDEVRRTYGLTNVSKLASNENPLGPSPLALEAIRRELSGLNLYPNGGLDLRRTLAENFDLKPENVIAGSGSEGIMSGIIRTFLCDDDEVLTTDAAFIGFQVLARSRGVKYRTVPYRDWHYDLPALAAQITENTKIVYLANPNNPTGTIFTRHEFDSFYRHVPERVLIILDEAYFEYAQDNPRYPDSMHYRYDNVITLRTFSKIYGLAGVRIGYGFAHEDLIANLLKVKLPFEPSTLAQAAGIGALMDKEFLHRSLELNARGLRLLTDSFRGMGIAVVPSDANFVMLPFASTEEARGLTEALLREGVIVRPLGAFGLPQCIRISTGTDEENARCVEAVGERLCKR